MFWIELDSMSGEVIFSFLASSSNGDSLEDGNKPLNPAVIFTCPGTVKLVQNNTGLRKHREYQFLIFLLPSKSDEMLNSKQMYPLQH